MKMILLFGLLLGLAAAASALPPVGTRNPQSLDDVIISESFDSGDEGTLPLGWTQVSVDTGRNSEVFRGGPTVWQKISRTGISTHTGPGVCVDAYNADLSPNDDWLILPHIDTLLAPISFTYWASSHDAQWLENFEVMVSTTGLAPANFTHRVENVLNAPHLWTQHTLNLSAYAGAPFYLAIHYNSTNEFLVKIDDVLLTGTRPDAAAIRPETAQSFSFDGNYPNPFNGQTSFRFTLHQPGRVGLVIYDLLGREVARPLDCVLSVGAYDIPYDAKGMPSGTYVVRLTPPFGQATHRITLLK
jgi:hypothetical protein